MKITDGFAKCAPSEMQVYVIARRVLLESAEMLQKSKYIIIGDIDSLEIIRVMSRWQHCTNLLPLSPAIRKAREAHLCFKGYHDYINITLYAITFYALLSGSLNL